MESGLGQPSWAGGTRQARATRTFLSWPSWFFPAEFEGVRVCKTSSRGGVVSEEKKKRKREGKRRMTRAGGTLVMSRTLLTIYTHLFNKVNEEISVSFRVLGGDESCGLKIQLKEN